MLLPKPITRTFRGLLGTKHVAVFSSAQSRGSGFGSRIKSREVRRKRSASDVILLRRSTTADASGAILCGVSLGYDIYPDISLLFIRGQGVITHSEWVYAMLAWLHDPGY